MRVNATAGSAISADAAGTVKDGAVKAAEGVGTAAVAAKNWTVGAAETVGGAVGAVATDVKEGAVKVGTGIKEGAVHAGQAAGMFRSA